MEKERRDQIIAQAKGVMLKGRGLTSAEIYNRMFPPTDIFGENEQAGFTCQELAEALKEEANDPYGIIRASGSGKRAKFTLKRERRTNPGKPDTDTDETKKIGTAGEHIVLAELLFRGYEANIMSVDDGIDIVASKNNKIYFIQVKTTYLENEKISVSIPIASFERVRPHDVRYFIVIREGYGSARVLMFHQHDIITNAANGYIDKSETNYNLKIEFRADGIPVLYNNRGDTTRIPSATQEMHKFNL